MLCTFNSDGFLPFSAQISISFLYEMAFKYILKEGKSRFIASVSKKFVRKVRYIEFNIHLRFRIYKQLIMGAILSKLRWQMSILSHNMFMNYILSYWEGQKSLTLVFNGYFWEFLVKLYNGYIIAAGFFYKV